MRIKRDAVLAIQEAAEHYLVDVLNRSWLNALHAKRVTATDKDMRLAVAMMPKMG